MTWQLLALYSTQGYIRRPPQPQGSYLYMCYNSKVSNSPSHCSSIPLDEYHLVAI
jgi:hypothetical protein